MPIITDLEHIENLKKFETQTWRHLKFNERLDALQKLEDRMAQEQGRAKRTVDATEELNKDVAGAFDKTYPDYIHVNKHFLTSSGNNLISSYDMMDTVIHEGRHAYQYDVLHGVKVNYRPDDSIVRQWMENDITGSIPRSNPVGHRFQSKEDDARNFTYDKMKSYELFFENDPQYQKFIQKETIRRIDDDIKAQEVYNSKDYKEIINNKISADYAEIQQRLKESIQKLEQERRLIDKQLMEVTKEQMQVTKGLRPKEDLKPINEKLQSLQQAREQIIKESEKLNQLPELVMAQTIEQAPEKDLAIMLTLL